MFAGLAGAGGGAGPVCTNIGLAACGAAIHATSGSLAW